MTNAQTFSIVALAVAGIVGAIAALVWGPSDQRVAVATMILASTAPTVAALIAAFKAVEAKAVAVESVEQVKELHVQVNSRLSALIAANERAFEAEKLVARAAGVAEGKGDPPLKAVESTKPVYTEIPIDHLTAVKPKETT